MRKGRTGGSGMSAKGRGLSNVILRADELLAIRHSDIERFKERIIAKLNAQKHKLPDDMNAEERFWKSRDNDAYDLAIQIVIRSSDTGTLTRA